MLFTLLCVFNEKAFADVDLGDPFFDSLKEDYEGFSDWFRKKQAAGDTAYLDLSETSALQAFLYVKGRECEAVGNLG